MTDQAQHAAVSISDEQLQEWADNRSDDAGRLARELLPLRRASAAPFSGLKVELTRWCDDRQADVLGCIDLNADEEASAVVWLDNFRAALAERTGPAATRVLPYPEAMTPELRAILGIMIFQSCPIAHQLRRLGHDIPEKTEAEQAYVLHWFIRLALQHGDRWSYVWEDEMRRMKAEQWQPLRRKEGPTEHG